MTTAMADGSSSQIHVPFNGEGFRTAATAAPGPPPPAVRVSSAFGKGVTCCPLSWTFPPDVGRPAHDSSGLGVKDARQRTVCLNRCRRRRLIIRIDSRGGFAVSVTTALAVLPTNRPRAASKLTDHSSDAES